MDDVGYSSGTFSDNASTVYSDDMFDDYPGFSDEELRKLESLADSEQFRVG